MKQNNETAGACSSPSVRALTKLTILMFLLQIVNRIKQTNETAGACSSPSVRALTKLTRHIPTQMLVEHKLFDPFHIASQSIGIDTDCLKERKFTKAQVESSYNISLTFPLEINYL